MSRQIIFSRNYLLKIKNDLSEMGCQVIVNKKSFRISIRTAYNMGCRNTGWTNFVQHFIAIGQRLWGRPFSRKFFLNFKFSFFNLHHNGGGHSIEYQWCGKP